MVKLFIYETVKCEVINVEFLSRNISLKNSAIIVKWECLKLLYLLKVVCTIDSQLKKKWHAFLGISNNNFSFFGLSNIFFFVFVFTILKKKIFIFNYF